MVSRRSIPTSARSVFSFHQAIHIRLRDCRFIALGLFLAAFSWVAQSSTVRMLTPEWLEWEFIETVEQGQAPESNAWFVTGSDPICPPPAEWTVEQGGHARSVEQVYGTRQVVRAAHQKFEAEVRVRFWLRLETALTEVGTVLVSHPVLGTATADASAQRSSPVFHWNQVGYAPGDVKRAYLDRYLGLGGELEVPVGTPFRLVDTATGLPVYSGTVAERPDEGFRMVPKPYQATRVLDFSSVTQAGEYRLEVDGLGQSGAVRIDPHVAAANTRLYALGLYHQRSGEALTLPYTRFVRGAGHTAPAEIPDATHPTNPLLAASAADAHNIPRHVAPVLTNVSASLYPFVKTGVVDVSGGHMDAGDYSKYTINSAQLVHQLRFAAESFPGAGALDDLGLPESGDGIGDLWQLAKVEADFLVKLQDDDGGFYFLVYPRARRYEWDVLPEEGDPQVVWPKNTSATAAAVGALAELGGAPEFQQLYPEVAATYLNAAVAGWQFLQSAFSEFGYDGAYQKMTHYGHAFFHDDEMAWAAAALFLATGDPQYDTALKFWMPDPESPSIRVWSWVRLYGGWGNAIRIYGATGTRPASPFRDPNYQAQCEAELLAAAEDQARWADESSFGVSYPEPSKRLPTAGWFFPQTAAFDLWTGSLVSTNTPQQARFRQAVATNLDYVHGANPVDRIFVTGQGVASPLNPVMQVADNDRQTLPPSGYPLGALATGMSWLNLYQQQLSAWMSPSYGQAQGPYPVYDRWTDVFNTFNEPTVVEIGNALGVLAGIWAAEGPVPTSPPAPEDWSVLGLPEVWPVGQQISLELAGPGVHGDITRVLWETSQGWWQGGATTTVVREDWGPFWIEIEAVLEDGRRWFGVWDYPALEPPFQPRDPIEWGAYQWYALNSDWTDTLNPGPGLTPQGAPGFVAVPELGRDVAAFSGYGSKAMRTLSDAVVDQGSIRLAGWVRPDAWSAYSIGGTSVLCLYQHWDAQLDFYVDKWRHDPEIWIGSQRVVPSTVLGPLITPGAWHYVEMEASQSGPHQALARVRLNGDLIHESHVSFNWGRTAIWYLEIGNMVGSIADVASGH